MTHDREHPVDDLVRRAVGIDEDAVASEWSASEAKQALLQEITAMPTDTELTEPRSVRSRLTARRLIVVAAVATMTVATAVMAVADRGPFDDPVREACEPAVGENYPSDDCAEYVVSQAIDEIETNGTAEAQAVIADGVVSRDEYDAAAERWKQCAVDSGLAAFELVPEQREIGFAYASQWVHIEGMSGDEMFDINDDCAELHFRQLSRIWEAQQFPDSP